MVAAYVGNVYSSGTIPVRIAGSTVRAFRVIRGDGSRMDDAALSRKEFVQRSQARPLDVALGVARPAEVRLGTLLTPGSRLRRPITLTVGTDDILITVWSAEFEELGYGTHLTEAIADFQRTLAELYRTLSAERDRLGPGLLDTWHRLQLVIEDVP